jgi:hypothetical protein
MRYHTIIEKIDDQVGLSDIDYKTTRSLDEVAEERWQSWQSMVGHELPAGTRITLNSALVDGNTVYFLVFKYPDDYVEEMGWVDGYQCDTFYVKEVKS